MCDTLVPWRIVVLTFCSDDSVAKGSCEKGFEDDLLVTRAGFRRLKKEERVEL